jgi:chromosome segregation ATPase
LELRKRYEALKRQSDLTSQEKDKIHGQFQALIKVFSNQRKALQVSISKSKRFEDQATQLAKKNQELAQQNSSLTGQVDSLEQDLKKIQSRFKKERELLEIEIEDKKGVVMRCSADIAEITSQKQSLKT